MKDFKHTTENHVIVSFPPDSPLRTAFNDLFQIIWIMQDSVITSMSFSGFFSFLTCIDTIIASPAKERLQNKRWAIFI